MVLDLIWFWCFLNKTDIIIDTLLTIYTYSVIRREEFMV